MKTLFNHQIEDNISVIPVILSYHPQARNKNRRWVLDIPKWHRFAFMKCEEILAEFKGRSATENNKYVLIILKIPKAVK